MRFKRFRHPMQSLDDWWLVHNSERRLDRGPVYVAVMIGLMGPALSIVLLGPIPNSVIADMPSSLQVLMCAMILIHCIMGLYSTISGSHWFAPNVTRKRSYQLGYSAAPAGVAALLVYGYYLLENAINQGEPRFIVFSTLSGILTPALGIGIGVQALLFWLESRRIDRNEQILLEQKRIELNDEHSDDS